VTGVEHDTAIVRRTDTLGEAGNVTAWMHVFSRLSHAVSFSDLVRTRLKLAIITLRLYNANVIIVSREYEVGTLAIDGWAVIFGTARRGLGGAAARPGPSSLLWYSLCCAVLMCPLKGKKSQTSILILAI